MIRPLKYAALLTPDAPAGAQFVRVVTIEATRLAGSSRWRYEPLGGYAPLHQCGHLHRTYDAALRCGYNF